jgi:Domain of unknown function (DUF397)
MTGTPWVKAAKSSGSGSCVEVRRHGGAIEVRDSKDRSGPVLRFTAAEFDAFLDGARNREFDRLTAE